MLEKPQLTFHLWHDNHIPDIPPDTIYIPSRGRHIDLTLSISTNKKNTHFIRNKSKIILDVSGFQMTDIEFDNLGIRSNQFLWWFEKSERDHKFILTPREDIDLEPEVLLEDLEMLNLKMSNPPQVSEVELVIKYYYVDGITQGNTGITYTFPIFLEHDPRQEDEDLKLALSVDCTDVLLINLEEGKDQEGEGSLTFYFRPGSIPRRIRALATTSFVVSFSYDYEMPGGGALMTPQHTEYITLRRGKNARDWTIIPNTSMQAPSWLLKPPKGSPIIGAGPDAIVEFVFEHIFTTFSPGIASVNVTYSDVPGYKKGNFSLSVEKVYK
ncbi:hypothetical protein MMB68_05875 [Priestia sp. Y58]|uniref:hypothetical protein n=1 Tax=Priestia sp. Y58 TaxID=2922804 RepID=UPI0024060076|nr:hypothetical protein [Priestia sp. Y58]MDG0029090.1 hypothetical protein [Priestia sp. Y58]